MGGQCEGIDFENDEKVAWFYCPAFAPAVAFTCIFGILTGVHIVQAITFKKKFSWVIIMAGLWETAAFALRVAGSKDIRQEGFGIPHQILLALAPLWINAYVFMVLGRMVYFFLPEKRCFGISAQRLTLIFVVLDIVAFLVQGSSTSLMNSDDPKIARIGINIYMGGMGLQELFILIFTGLAIRFQKRMFLVEVTNPPPTQWRPLLYAAYAGLLLITIRIIYRLVEFSSGFHSAIATNELALYALDAATMSLAILLFCIFHPGRFLVGPDSEFPKKVKKGKMHEKNGEKKGKGSWFGMGRRGGNDGWVEVERRDPEDLPLEDRRDYVERSDIEEVPLQHRRDYQDGGMAEMPARERYHP